MSKWMAIAALVSVSFFGVSAANADPVGGPTSRIAWVDAGYTRTFTLDCWGGEWTAIRISGDGDTDLDLYVYDAAGNLITSGTGYSDFEEVHVLPHFRQTLTIQVVNRGSVYNEFFLRVW